MSNFKLIVQYKQVNGISWACHGPGLAKTPTNCSYLVGAIFTIVFIREENKE